MAVSMIWGSPGSGKTVASTAPKKEKPAPAPKNAEE